MAERRRVAKIALHVAHLAWVREVCRGDRAKGLRPPFRRVSAWGTETLPAPGTTATPRLHGAGSLGENHPKPRAKSESDRDNRTPSPSQPPFWALPLCLSNFARGADINASLAGRRCSGPAAAEHPLSPPCPGAGAAPAGGWSPASCWPLVPPWAGVPRPVTAHARIWDAMPRSLSVPTGSLPRSHLAPARRGAQLSPATPMPRPGLVSPRLGSRDGGRTRPAPGLPLPPPPSAVPGQGLRGGHSPLGLGGARGGTAGGERGPAAPRCPPGPADRPLGPCGGDRACAPPASGMRAAAGGDPRAGYRGGGRGSLSPPSLPPSLRDKTPGAGGIPPAPRTPLARSPPHPPGPGLTWLRGTCGKRLRVVGLFGR